MEKLKEIISEYTGVDASKIDENMSLSGDIGLDSFGIILLICEIENAFNVSIPETAIVSFQTLKDLYSYVEKNALHK